MSEFVKQLKPSFPPLVTGHVYENHFKLEYSAGASIEWVDIEANNANIYNAGIYASDTRLFDLNNEGKTIINFPVGLAYNSEMSLIVWTKNNVCPKVSVKINTAILSAKLKWLLVRPVDWTFGNKIFRFNAGNLAYLNDVVNSFILSK